MGNVGGGREMTGKLLMRAKRLWLALALRDIMRERPLGKVAEEYGMERGWLQAQHAQAGTFSGNNSWRS